MLQAVDFCSGDQLIDEDGYADEDVLSDRVALRRKKSSIVASNFSYGHAGGEIIEIHDFCGIHEPRVMVSQAEK